MKKLLVAAVAIAFAHAAHAMNFTGTVGLRNNNAEDTGAASNKSQMSFAAGATTMFEMAPQFNLKTGAMYTQRTIATEATGVTTTATFSYLDVPVYADYAFTEMFSAYAGLNLGLKVGSTCSRSTGSCLAFTDEKSMIMPFVVGANMTFEKAWNFGLFYEMSTEYAKNTKGSAFGLNAGYMF